MRDRNFERFPFSKSEQGMISRKATCGLCGEVALVSDKGNGIPADQIALKLRQRKWRVGKSADDDRCPQCVAAEAAVKRRRPKVSDNVIQLHEDQPMVEAVLSPAPVADPPRKPTREDRRRISEALDLHYDIDGARYRKAATDDSLAKHLTVPRAWVTEIRDLMYGPEGNEQDELTAKAIIDLEASLKRLADDFMERYAKIEADVTALKAGRLPKAA